MLKGKVSFINPELKASSKIVLLRVELKNPLGEYQSGMQAWITLKSEAINVVAIPTHVEFREGHKRGFADLAKAREEGRTPPMKSSFKTYDVLTR